MFTLVIIGTISKMASSKQGLIVFFITAEKTINGGILSIFSLCKTSRELESVHKSQVVISTFPGTQSYGKNDLFENDEIIYSFDQIARQAPPKRLLLHVPEYASTMVLYELRSKYSSFLAKVPEVHVNILNQNILQMQRPSEVAEWFTVAPLVTQTTAHDRYSSQETADTFCLATAHLSTFVDPSQYLRRPYSEKEQLILLSPDAAEKRSAIVATLKKDLPDYRFVVVQNMAYQQYKDLASRAKFIVTFGEGFDGYFVEGFFSGAITLAVYNDNFFPDKSFSTHANLYPDYEAMLAKISSDVKALDQSNKYEKIVGLNFEKIAELYSFKKYFSNLKNFYLGNYDFIPQRNAFIPILSEIYHQRNQSYVEKQKLLNQFEGIIDTKNKELVQKNKELEQVKNEYIRILHSTSWKVTRPLRKLNDLFFSRVKNDF